MYGLYHYIFRGNHLFYIAVYVTDIKQLAGEDDGSYQMYVQGVQRLNRLIL